MQRRQFLTLLAGATLSAATACSGAASSTRTPTTATPDPGSAAASTTLTAPLLPPPAVTSRVALPGGAVLSTLPGHADLLALTLDDGVNSEVVRAYTQLAHDTGIRLTYFVNGTYASWTNHTVLLRPLVESGQIQLGNHTWSHPDLTTVPTSRIADELKRNDTFLRNTYGISAAPYFRPPYGHHNHTVDTVATDLGYTVPTLWNGSLADSTLVTENFILQRAAEDFTPQTIVIGHLNHPPATHVYPQLLDIIRDRNLRTVTLNDVLLKPPSHPA